MQNRGTIAEAPSGQIPIGESRFGTHDIRLSSALCALGFSLKIDSQPITVTIDADKTYQNGKEYRIVTFFHEGTTKLGDFTANHVELWWKSPAGKFTIVGYDDALAAMRRVFIERKKLITFAKFAPKYRYGKNSVIGIQSLHGASVLAACEIKLIGYDATGAEWIFAEGAEAICQLMERGGKPKSRPLSNDLCIDWMLEALRYHDWLKKLTDDPENIPLIEMRDGERILMISKGMKESEQRTWINRL